MQRSSRYGLAAFHRFAFHYFVLVRVHPCVGRFGLLCQARDWATVVDREVRHVFFLDPDLHAVARKDSVVEYQYAHLAGATSGTDSRLHRYIWRTRSFYLVAIVTGRKLERNRHLP